MSLRGKRQPKSSGGIFSVYCGLGESFGAPKHATDKLCQEHDDNYKLISEQGHNPYFDYNWADELFLEGLEKIVPSSKREAFVGKIAQMVFKGEKLLFQKAAYEEGEDHKRKRLEPNTPEKKQKIAPDIDPIQKIKATQRYIEYGVDGEGNIHRDFRDPLFNLPSSSQVTTGDKAVATGIMPDAGSGNTPGLSETPIDTVMDVHRGPPHYSFSSLPYIEESNFIQQFVNTKDIVYRMTSPYDCAITAASADLNVNVAPLATTTVIGPVADISDVTPQKARWFAFYAGMYKYYHVVSARWTMSIENLNNKPMWVHQYYSNETSPPVAASNQDMMLWPDFESHYVGVTAMFPTSQGRVEANELQNNIENQETTIANQNTNYESAGNTVNSRGVGPILKLAGSYRPGQYDHDIRLDENVENWTATDKNPKLSERLGFRFKIDSNSMLLSSVDSSDDQLAFKYRFQVEYLVEFKELKDGLKYPIQRQPITVTLAFDGSSLN